MGTCTRSLSTTTLTAWCAWRVWSVCICLYLRTDVRTYVCTSVCLSVCLSVCMYCVGVHMALTSGRPDRNCSSIDQTSASVSSRITSSSHENALSAWQAETNRSRTATARNRRLPSTWRPENSPRKLSKIRRRDEEIHGKTEECLAIDTCGLGNQQKSVNSASQ